MEQYLGYIISPLNNEESIESVRLIKSEDNIEIEFSANSHHQLNIATIHGSFTGLGDVTLINCKNIGMSTGSGGYQKKYSAEYLLVGDYISNLNEKTFDSIKIEMPGLLGWTKISGIKNDFFATRTVTTEDVPNVILYSSDQYTVELYSVVNYSFKRQNNEVSLKEDIGLKVQAQNKSLSVLDFLEHIVEFQKLFFIIGNTSSELGKVTLNNEKEFSTQLFWKGKRSLGDPSINNPSLKYNDILPNIIDIVSNWISKREIHTSIDLILEKSINAKLSIENYFLNNCFAIETFHRRFKNFRIFDQQEFKTIKEEILKSVENDEIREILSNNLAHINEPNFRRRLIDFSEDFGNVLPKDFQIDSFITQTVKTRNFLVHRSSEKNIFTKFEMLYATIFIEIIVKINIYRVLGIEEDLIKKSLIHAGGNTISMYEYNKSFQF